MDTLKKIDLLKKAMSKHSPRNYATVIGIDKGHSRAVITDGFSLFYTGIDLSRLPEVDLIDSAIAQDLRPSAVKFPRYDLVIPKKTANLHIEFDDLLKIAKSQTKSTKLLVRLTPRPEVDTEGLFTTWTADIDLGLKCRPEAICLQAYIIKPLLELMAKIEADGLADIQICFDPNDLKATISIWCGPSLAIFVPIYDPDNNLNK